VPVSGPLVPPNSLEQVITPLLFEASRLLSIVPAVFGVLYNLFNAWYAPINGKVVPIDYVVSALWVRHSLNKRVFFGRTHARTQASYDRLCLGRTYRLSMSVLDDGPIPAMEGVLSPVINPDSITSTASYLLARDPFQPDPNRARKATGDLLGCHRQLHVLLSGRSVMGDEQPLVGNQ
jgi:hypothetical protein